MSENRETNRCIMRSVTLLDCVPGRANRPGTGEPCAIITLASGSDIEAPLMLGLQDCRTLLDSLQVILNHFEVDEGYHDAANSFAEDSPIPAPSHTTTASSPVNAVNDPHDHPSGDSSDQPAPEVVWLKLRDRPRTKRFDRIPILGGYKMGGRIILMARMLGQNGPGHDCLFRIGKRHMISRGPFRDNEIVTPKGWPRFAARPARSEFCIGGGMWRKLSISHLRRIIGSQIWTQDLK